MGVLKQKDIIARRHRDGSIYCAVCGDPEEDAKLLMEKDWLAQLMTHIPNIGESRRWRDQI